MKYNIRGSKIEVTEAINEYIKSKLSKVEKYLDDNDEVEAKALISAKGKDQKVEVTIWSGKYNIRAEESNADLYAAIDLVIDKLERQFKKYKGKLSIKRFKEDSLPEIRQLLEEKKYF
jgi:putative sigma-54 modulation protein